MDELDKTIKELKGVKSKKFASKPPDIQETPAPEPSVPETPETFFIEASEVLSTATVPESTSTSVDQADYKKEMYKNYYAVHDTYLPNVLCLLKMFKTNREAREFIRKVGVMLNGNLTKNVDATNHSENFILVISGQEYQIFKK